MAKMPWYIIPIKTEKSETGLIFHFRIHKLYKYYLIPKILLQCLRNWIGAFLK